MGGGYCYVTDLYASHNIAVASADNAALKKKV